KLFDDAERGANATLSIDLEKQEIRGPDGGVVKFDIDAHRKHCLLNGLDDIGLTMVKQDKIERFEQKSKAARAWAWVSGRARPSAPAPRTIFRLVRPRACAPRSPVRSRPCGAPCRHASARPCGRRAARRPCPCSPADRMPR